MKYDVIIVGAGPAGYFCAYEFSKKAPNKKVLLIDKGRDIHTRNCPVLNHKLEKCPLNKEGFRVPDFAIAREVIEIAGGLLRVTSANLSSTPSLDEITEAMRPVFEKCDVVIDAGRCPGGVHSTVVRVTSDNCVKILRQGAIDITPCLMR